MRRQQARRAAQAVLLAAISALAGCGPGAIPAPGNVHTALAHAAAIRVHLEQTGYGDEDGTKATFDGVLTQNGFAGTEDDNGDAGRVLETGGVIYISGRLLTRHLPAAPAASWGKLVPAATPLLAARSLEDIARATMEDTVTEGHGTVTLAPLRVGGGAGGMTLTVTVSDWAPPSVAMTPPSGAADLCDPYVTTDFIGRCGPDVPLHGTLTVTVSGAVSRSRTFTSATCDEPSIVLGGPESDAPSGIDVASVRLDEKQGGIDLVHTGAPDDQFTGPLTITLQQRYPSVGSYSGTLRWEHSALGQSTPPPDLSTVHVEGTFSCRPS